MRFHARLHAERADAAAKEREALNAQLVRLQRDWAEAQQELAHERGRANASLAAVERAADDSAGRWGGPSVMVSEPRDARPNQSHKANPKHPLSQRLLLLCSFYLGWQHP